MKRFTISFRYTKHGEKKPGPVQRYVVYANNIEEAKQLVEKYANYPNLQLLDVQES